MHLLARDRLCTCSYVGKHQRCTWFSSLLGKGRIGRKVSPGGDSILPHPGDLMQGWDLLGVLWPTALSLKTSWERDSQSFPCRRQFQTMYPKRTSLQEKQRKAGNQTCFTRVSFLQSHIAHCYHQPQQALCLLLGPCSPEAAREALSSWAPGGQEKIMALTLYRQTTE